MKLDGSKESGYLTKTSLGGVIALAVIISLWSSLTDSPAENVGVDLTVTLSENTVRGLFSDGCDLDDYRIMLYSGTGYGDLAETVDVPRGERTPNGGCRYHITTEVPKADRYGVKWEGKGGDPFPDVWRDHDDAATTDDDGDSVLVFDVNW